MARKPKGAQSRSQSVPHGKRAGTARPRSRGLRRRGQEPLTKSEQMARVRSTDTDAELRLRRAVWHKGLRFRVTCRRLPGSPDVVFTRWRLAIFVDGCFWHGCPIHYTSPKTNSTFWRQKKAQNRARDKRVDSELKELGWTILRVWEHEVSDDIAAVVLRVQHALIKAGWTSSGTVFRSTIAFMAGILTNLRPLPTGVL